MEFPIIVKHILNLHPKNVKISEKEKALQSEKVQRWLKGKEIKKVIFVKDRLVNFVVE